VKPARIAAALAFVSVVGGGADAWAFCRSRTCNEYDPTQHCEKVDNCVVSGYELWWNTSCVSFDAQADGSRKLGIDADTVTDVVSRAFAPWLAADCGTGTPSMVVSTYGPVSCNEPENPDPTNPHPYNRTTEKGANVVMFRDDVWPYPNSTDAFALTTVTFDPSSGRIYDADIEVNSADFDIAVDSDTYDLQSILTHEVGHFLGMAHAASADMTSTMRQRWAGTGMDLRTLSDDDTAGICDAYPPERSAPKDCEPLNGLADGCHVAKAKESSGCTLARRSEDDPAAKTLLFGAGLLAGLAFVRRRRRAG
jgi:MYXO-CTERM domain-containing protein